MKKFTKKFVSSVVAVTAATCMLTTIAPIAHAADLSDRAYAARQEIEPAAPGEAENNVTYTLTVDGVAESHQAGETVQLSAAFYKVGSKAYRFSHWSGDTYLLADSTNPDISFVMPQASVTLNKNFVIVGDVNGDGDVNAIDLNLLRRMVEGIMLPKLAADINNDGRWDDDDVYLMRRMLQGLYSPTE